jgi:DNA invertase Pin-like site-specific DNA recombinase
VNLASAILLAARKKPFDAFPRCKKSERKLTEHEQEEARRLFLAGVWTVKELAKRYGVKFAVISELVR